MTAGVAVIALCYGGFFGAMAATLAIFAYTVAMLFAPVQSLVFRRRLGACLAAVGVLVASVAAMILGATIAFSGLSNSPLP